MADYTLTTSADVFPAGQDVSGDDRIYGLEGDDVLAGGAGADLLDGGDGFDTVTYAGAAVGIFVNPMSRVTRNDGTGDTFVSIERFVLSGFDDYFRADQSFTAGFEADGGSGRDRIYATRFSDTLSGGEGNDDLRGGDGADVVRGGAGNDLLHGEGGRDEIFGEEGDDLIYGGTNNDRIDGGDGLDTLVLYDGPGSYELGLLADGSVRILRLAPEYEDAGTTTLNGSFDIVTSIERLRYYDGTIFDLAAWIAANSAPAGFNVVYGTDSDDALVGTSGQDAIYGLSGSDTLAGGEGDDLLSGGGGADSFDGGDGVDTVTYLGASGPVLVNVPHISFGPYGSPEPTHEAYGDTFANIERIELSALDDVLYWQQESGIEVLGHGGDDLVVGGAGADALDGGAGKDVLNGREGDDVLNGGDGIDRLEGGDGDDLLDGGLGSDTIYGGLGTDTLAFGGRSAGVSIGFTGSEDGAYHSIEIFRLTDFDDRIRLYASYNDEGHAAVSDVHAGAGNDLVDGGVLAGSLYGEDGDDTLIAGHYGSLLDGGAGDDTLHSAWGGDLIEGGDGTDTVHYDRPRDEYHIERDGDAIVVAHLASGWVDRLTGVEFLSFPDRIFLDRLIVDASTIAPDEAASALRTGSLAADTMAGEATLANSLFGLSGADRLTGGGEGDMISGGDDDDIIVGGAGGDSLYGGDGEDSLTGGAGDDRLAAGAGNDLLHLWNGGGDESVDGGDGNDSLFFGATLDLADLVDGGGGTDTLVLQGAYGALTLSGNVSRIENVSILGGNNTALGESGSNRYDYVLTTHDSNFAAGVQARINAAALLEGEDFTFDGSAEKDASFVVYGGKGRDSLTGGLGNDIFFYAEERFASGDTVNGGAGYDGMFLRGNYTIDFNAPGYTGLFTNIENLTLTSATDERYARGGGTEFDYKLTLSDAIVDAGQALTISGSLLLATEAMVLDAAQESNGTLRLFGGKASDTLKGGAQADLIHGNLGADLLAGNGGADTFRYDGIADSNAASRDHILDFAAGTDKIDVSRIDSNSRAAGDQAFSWIGSDAFSGSAGQLRAYEQNGTWFVEGDTDGDSVADLVIALTLQGPNPLGTGDFLL
jgi:Ca2+-binding RTX toxin-like protein